MYSFLDEAVQHNEQAKRAQRSHVQQAINFGVKGNKISTQGRKANNGRREAKTKMKAKEKKRIVTTIFSPHFDGLRFKPCLYLAYTPITYCDMNRIIVVFPIMLN